jgi:tripartite-type tricarboxylate transporter receptor subunit TctC
MKELIALAKQRNAEGQPLSFGSGGTGTTAHLGAEVLKQAAGINMLHIPYRGTSQAMTDVLTGRVDMMFAPIVVALPHIRPGTVRGLSITSPDRSPLLPEVSTVREAGLPEAETEVWIGLFAPARTPEAVIGTLYECLVRALKVRSYSTHSCAKAGRTGCLSGPMVPRSRNTMRVVFTSIAIEAPHRSISSVSGASEAICVPIFLG